MLQGFSRGVRIPMLLLLVLPATILFVLYKFGPMQQMISDETQQLNPPQRQPSKYNLMEDTYGSNWAKTPSDKYLSASRCTIEYANQNQLQQDHPCVIRLIQEKYLRQPAAKDLPYKLDHPEKIDPSDGQATDIRVLLKNKTDGFFVECGGFDGEFLSNTLFVERYLGWSGLLIEANEKSFGQLVARNRKAFSLPNCLSTQPYPIQVVFDGALGSGSLIAGPVSSGVNNATAKKDVYPVQCFPFYSILLALGRTDVDYFGLDVEGAEYKVLETIPFHKVNIKTMTVEWNHIPEGEPALTRLMESNHFKKSHMISLYYSLEVVYIHESLVA